MGRTHVNAVVSLKSRIKTVKNECDKHTKEYESLKTEVVKAVQGTSKFPMDLLSELVDAARTKMLAASEMLCTLNDELEESNLKMLDIREDYNRILEWSRIFDESEMAVKKMIASYIIRGVHVSRDYHLRLEFNINLAQFELGLELENAALLA